MVYSPGIFNALDPYIQFVGDEYWNHSCQYTALLNPSNYCAVVILSSKPVLTTLAIIVSATKVQNINPLFVEISDYYKVVLCHTLKYFKHCCNPLLETTTKTVGQIFKIFLS